MSNKACLRITTVLIAVILLLTLSCSDGPTQVTVRDDNQDQVAHLSPDPNILGNTEMFFIPETIQGSAFWIIN